MSSCEWAPPPKKDKEREANTVVDANRFTVNKLMCRFFLVRTKLTARRRFTHAQAK